MSRLCRRDRRADSLGIPQFPHQYHVRVFPQHRPERIRVASAVQADLTLVHHGPFMRMDIFYRIFQRNHQRVPVFIDLLYHGGQSRRAAASGGPGHKHETALPFLQPDDRFRHPQLFRGRHLCIHQMKRKGYASFLLVGVGPASPAAGNRKGKIIFPFFLKPLPLDLRHDMNQDVKRVR